MPSFQQSSADVQLPQNRTLYAGTGLESFVSSRGASQDCGLQTVNSHRQPQQEPCKPYQSLKQASSLICRTYGSSYLQHWSSYCSAPVPGTGGTSKDKPPSPELWPRTIRRRPKLINLQHSESAPEVASLGTFQEKGGACKRKTMTKRSRSAEPEMTNKPRFTSPDRYTSLRTPVHTSSSPFRTSCDPSLLGTAERLNRRTSGNVGAFRSVSDSRSRRVVDNLTAERSSGPRPPHYTPSFVDVLEMDRNRLNPGSRLGSQRRSSTGSIWGMGSWTSATDQTHAVDLGNGMIMASGSNAPMVNSNFVLLPAADSQVRAQEKRLAVALGIDTAARVLPVSETTKDHSRPKRWNKTKYHWENGEWSRTSISPRATNSTSSVPRPEKAVPTTAFRVLDAPRLKDDYYCSVLAYSRRCRTLAVALTHRVYLWTERYGVQYPPLAPVRQTNYVTSLAFSSDDGSKGILAIARQNGLVVLWSLFEQKVRFELQHSSMACSIAFRPTTSTRMSLSLGMFVKCEDLLVGDDAGRIYYYSVEWLEHGQGSVTLLSKIEAHSQNVCGLAWADHGNTFVSGGNDNCALLFEVENVFRLQHLFDTADNQALPGSPTAAGDTRTMDGRQNGTYDYQISSDRVVRNESRDGASHSNASNEVGQSRETRTDSPFNARRGRMNRQIHLLQQAAPPTPPRSPATRTLAPRLDLADTNTIGIMNAHRYSFPHSAAVKAIAFAPWQPTLLATGGGSNDKQIHFHHTGTGTTLAVINVYAQITSLIWSTTRREIVATFGYAQPEHEIRVAVFAWPSCECVVSIPWERKANGEIGRALWAIPYPGGPNDAAPERLRQAVETNRFSARPRPRLDRSAIGGIDMAVGGNPPTPETTPERRNISADDTRIRHFARGEGEPWASRTEEEGSLIIACCDQTVKFFEVWAGKSKGRSHGLGSKAGVLGGSKVLEGWCDEIAIEEIGTGEEVIQ